MNTNYTEDPKILSNYTSTCITNSSISCQIDPLKLEMEMITLPMLSDLYRKELRIPAKNLNAQKLKILKQICKENGMVVVTIGKNLDKMIVIRKKADLLRKQEIARLDLEKAIALKLEQDLANQAAEKLKEEAELKQEEVKISIDCQTDAQMNLKLNNQTVGNSAARRRARRLALIKPPPPISICAGIQTTPLGFIVCPWCSRDVSPASQIGHLAMCKAENRLKLAPFKLKSPALSKAKSPPIRARGGSSTRADKPITAVSCEEAKCKALKRECLAKYHLEAIHPGDTDALVRAARNLCSQAMCPSTGADDAGAKRNIGCSEGYEQRRELLRSRLRHRVNGLVDKRRR